MASAFKIFLEGGGDSRERKIEWEAWNRVCLEKEKGGFESS